MEKDYLVDGAKLLCICGSEPGLLKITKGHGYISRERKKANCKDCVEEENIPYFGTCQKNQKDGRCQGFMKLDEKWENISVSLTESEKIDGEDAIGMDSVLICKREGEEEKMLGKKILMETIGKKWGAYGFQFEGYHYYRWTFSRRVDEVDQKISVQKGIYGYPELRFEVELFRGSERKDVGKSKIQELSGLKEFGMFLPYEGEEGLRELLNKWGDLIGEKVIDRLADIPVKWHEWPGKESEKKLYEKREELAERFYKRHGINEEAAEEILLGKMKEELDEIIGKPLAKVEERMVELAAVYGKLWIRMFKGEWMYYLKENLEGALITKSTCNNIYPLGKITAYWHAEWWEILEDYAKEKQRYEEYIKNRRRKRKG